MKKQRLLTTALLVGSLIAMVGGLIGGTLAWLMAETPPVTNTFTYGDINITLTETDTGDGDNNPNTNTYSMVPGQDIAKDPKLTVLAGSESSWLFVKIEESTDPVFDNFLTYEIAEGWTALDGVDGVYYREVEKSEDAQAFDVLKDNKVTVKADVTKEQLNALTKNPTLTLTGYAVQRDTNVAAADAAWALITGANAPESATSAPESTPETTPESVTP